MNSTHDADTLLAALRAEVARMRPDALVVEVIPEVNDVTLVTDDDGLPTGWAACVTCGAPCRHVDRVCAVCRVDLATHKSEGGT